MGLPTCQSAAQSPDKVFSPPAGSAALRWAPPSPGLARPRGSSTFSPWASSGLEPLPGLQAEPHGCFPSILVSAWLAGGGGALVVVTE